MYYSLYNWIGENEITKLQKYIFASNSEKRTQKQAQKDTNENGLIDIFSKVHA